jgi:hypothetical protein
MLLIIPFKRRMLSWVSIDFYFAVASILTFLAVVGTLCAPEYALFVSHSHPNGQAHFNVFSDRKSGGRWGTFTTDTEYPSDEGGPSYIEEIPPKAMFDSKVSPVCLNAGSDDKDWDTLMLARLRFPTDATEPTLQ